MGFQAKYFSILFTSMHNNVHSPLLNLVGVIKSDQTMADMYRKRVIATLLNDKQPRIQKNQNTIMIIF